MTYLIRVRIMLFTLVLVLSFVWGCGKTAQEDEQGRHELEPETAGTNIVHLDKHKVFHAGIQVEAVQKKSVSVPLTVPGKVSFNEKKLSRITARVSGRIEKITAFTNANVTPGEILMEVFSQEYSSMQSEFLQAAERLKRLKGGSEDERSTAQSIYGSVKQKLIVIGAVEEDLRQIEASQKAQSFLSVRAPFSGTIIERSVQQGEFVQIGTELFELADLSTLWVLVDIYEKDLPRVRTGMKVGIEALAFPTETFEGTISTIYGVLDEKTRTVKARVDVRNRARMLKPGMFCSVDIQTEFGKETIKIPAGGLLGETEKHFVFVAVDDTTFEKRDVRTGVETREFAEILDGLLVGEKIVIKGGFFLKSELAKETFGEEH